MKISKMLLITLLISSSQVLFSNSAQSAGLPTAINQELPVTVDQSAEALQNKDDQGGVSLFSKFKGLFSIAVALTTSINATLRAQDFIEIISSDREDKLQPAWLNISSVLFNSFIAVKALECAQKSFTRRS